MSPKCKVRTAVVKRVDARFGLALVPRGPTRGAGQCPRAALFGEAARLVKRRNSKWSFTNEPEVRCRFHILVKVEPTIRLAGTVPVLTSVPVSSPG